MKNLRFAAAVLIAVLVALPMFAARGSADFTRFVALGDSYGAGVESGSLNERHQPWSWPAVIARQVGLNLCPANAVATDPCFSQPRPWHLGPAQRRCTTRTSSFVRRAAKGCTRAKRMSPRVPRLIAQRHTRPRARGSKSVLRARRNVA